MYLVITMYLVLSYNSTCKGPVGSRVCKAVQHKGDEPWPALKKGFTSQCKLEIRVRKAYLRQLLGYILAEDITPRTASVNLAASRKSLSEYLVTVSSIKDQFNSRSMLLEAVHQMGKILS